MPFFETPRVPFYQGAEAFADVVKDTWKKIFDEWDEDNREWQFGHDGFAYEYYFDERGTRRRLSRSDPDPGGKTISKD